VQCRSDFHGQKRSKDTHASTTDPDARLYRKGKGKETKLCFTGVALAICVAVDGRPPRRKRTRSGVFLFCSVAYGCGRQSAGVLAEQTGKGS
jgi:hypothetical protein